MKRIILTGATGFVGKWLLAELLDAGIEVTVILRNVDKLDSNFVNKVSVYESEYYNFDKLEILQKDYDAFFHLAWDGVKTEYKDKINIQMNNINMSVAALYLAKRMGCKRFISTGTVAEYALFDNVINFEQKQCPSNIYGAMKVSVYYILKVLSKQLGISFIWAVVPSTFGEGRNDNIINYTIEKLLRNKKPQYGDLNQLWDFLYVREVSRALRLIGEYGIANKVYGIGSGQYRPLKDYILMIRDIIDPKLELGIGELPQMSQKAYSSCVGIYDLIRDTNFNVEIGFEEGVRNTILYYKEELLKEDRH